MSIFFFIGFVLLSSSHAAGSGYVGTRADPLDIIITADCEVKFHLGISIKNSSDAPVTLPGRMHPEHPFSSAYSLRAYNIWPSEIARIEESGAFLTYSFSSIQLDPGEAVVGAIDLREIYPDIERRPWGSALIVKWVIDHRRMLGYGFQPSDPSSGVIMYPAARFFGFRSPCPFSVAD